jgi:enterochelin esterase-like enzyme
MSRGRIVEESLESELLRGNPLGDPSEREVLVYLPPGYDGRELPVVYGLVGYTGTGRMLLNADPLLEDLRTKMDRLIAEGRCGPMIVVMPDCFTKVGGNQYINSSATGPYEHYLLQEVIPLVEERYACGRRAVWGKSSGGYGAMVLGMRHPDIFSALASHSGDAAFEYCYIPDFPKALRAFRDAGGPEAWLEGYWQRPDRRRKDLMPVLNALGMAAHYSPNPESTTMGIDFPFDLETGEFRPEVWERWREWDPVNMLERYADNLRRLRLVYIDCGTEDEFNLIWGARALHAKLEALGVPHRYEEFDDGHMNVTYRYDISLPLLYDALTGE